MKYLVTWQNSWDTTGIMQCKFFNTYEEAKEHKDFIKGTNAFSNITLLAIAEPKVKKTVKKIMVIDL